VLLVVITAKNLSLFWERKVFYDFILPYIQALRPSLFLLFAEKKNNYADNEYVGYIFHLVFVKLAQRYGIFIYVQIICKKKAESQGLFQLQ